MNFDTLRRQAQQIYTKRGGSTAAKADGEELKDVMRSKGILADKARAAAQALEDPGAPGEAAPRDPASPAPPSPEARS